MTRLLPLALAASALLWLALADVVVERQRAVAIGLTGRITD